MRKITALLLGVALCAGLIAALCGCKQEEGRTGYTIACEYFPGENKLVAEQTVKVYNTSENTLSQLKFQLYPNAYREGAANKVVSSAFESSCFYDGASYGKIEITALSGGEWEVGGADCDILTVTPVKPLFPDESAIISMSYTVTLPKAAHRLGVGKTAVNLTNFYPVLCRLSQNGFEEYAYCPYGDPFASDFADYDVSLTVPENFTAVYGGTGESVAQNGKTTYHVIGENVRDTAFVLSTQFKKAEAQSGGVAVEYYYVSDDTPETTVTAAAQAIGYFSKTFSPYRGKRYAVAETDFVFGGMEYSNLALISGALHKSERVHAVVHETAHQWWYAAVGSNQVTESWQDEGLAEYSTALFMQEFPDYGSSYGEEIRACERAYRSYFSVYSQLGGANTAMTRPLSEFSGDYEYRSVAYDKGVIMLDRVRQSVGEKKFFSALKSYAKEYEGKCASRADFLSCFENAGARSEELFVSFLDGKCVI